MDRRVKRTRNLLGNALLELVQEKKFEQITIQDITDRADLNRATFYLHYGSKEDNTMVSYARFCDDLDIVFNLPVFLYFTAGQRERADDET